MHLKELASFEKLSILTTLLFPHISIGWIALLRLFYRLF